MNLSASQIYALARAAGFPPLIAVTMTAIALRESSGNQSAFNGNASTGDRSYGLWQINLKDPSVYALMTAKFPEIAQNEQWLLTGSNNARAAFALWGCSNKNLETAWYINRQPYQTRYEVHLPEAQAAALAAFPK